MCQKLPEEYKTKMLEFFKIFKNYEYQHNTEECGHFALD
jgi:hypothetical protein